MSYNSPVSPSYSYYPNDPVGYPHLYEKTDRPTKHQVPCSTGLLYSESNGWYCPTAPCVGPRPHDRARCDLHTGQWVTNTIHGEQGTYKNMPIQMQPCELDWKQPLPPGQRGKAVCDQLTGRYHYDQSADELADLHRSGGRSPYTGMHSNRSESKQSHTSQRGRDGMSNANHDVVNKTHRMQGGLTMDRAYQGRKGVPFIDGSGYLHPSQTGLSSNLHRQRGIWQRNSVIVPLQMRHAEPAKKVLGPSPFATSRVSKHNQTTSKHSPLTHSDEVNSRGIMAGSGETHESSARMHRGGMN